MKATRAIGKIVIQAFIIVLVSAGLAIALNFIRPKGIPLVTDIPYEIFAPCKDSEALSEAIDREDLANPKADSILYVDARPAEEFVKGHRDGAFNLPYSALFGASEEDLANLKTRLDTEKPTAVIVYGDIADPATPSKRIDFAKALAEQLIETGIKGVKHITGGLGALNKTGTQEVQPDGGR